MNVCLTGRAREALEVYGHRYVWPCGEDAQLGILPAAAGAGGFVQGAAAAIGFGRKKKKRKPATPKVFQVPIWSHTKTGPGGERLPANERERYDYLLRLRDAGWGYTPGRGWYAADREDGIPQPPTPTAALQYPTAYGYLPPAGPAMGSMAPGLVPPTGFAAPAGAPTNLMPILLVGLGGIALLAFLGRKKR